MIKLKSLLITENFQLAMKVYGGSLTPDDIDFLTKLSEKDYTFKILTDLWIEDERGKSFNKWNDKDWENAVIQLRNYNKNVFPIVGFNYDSIQPVVTKQLLEARAKVIAIVASWPKIAKRNLRRDIALPRNQFSRVLNNVEYINQHLYYLNNRSEEIKAKIFQKIFSSNHETFEEVLDFVEDKRNLLSGGTYDKVGLYKIVQANDYDLNIVYDRGNIVVVDVTGQSGIKLIGCNSLWCFTYGDEYGLAGEQWDQYSYNSHVYAIVNFSQDQNDPDFIHIVTKPFQMQGKETGDEGEEIDDPADTHIYNMENEQIWGNAEYIVVQLARGDRSILNVFTWEKF